MWNVNSDGDGVLDAKCIWLQEIYNLSRVEID